jgi:hypothetical protein
MLADLQQRLESPHSVPVHAPDAMSRVAMTTVMRVTVCLKWKAATSHNGEACERTLSFQIVWAVRQVNLWLADSLGAPRRGIDG